MSQPEEMSQQQLDALIKRVQHAIENELALSVDDMRLLLLAIHTLSLVQQKLEDKETTLFKLRKLLGMIKKSERRNGSDSKKRNSGQRRSSNGNRNRANAPPTTISKHAIDPDLKGSVCSACGHGKLYKFEPAKLLRISGNCPYTATQHISERLRCNSCQTLITAELPTEVLADGTSDQRYGYSARSIMSMSKFFSGTPYFHQGTVTQMFGMNLSASTIFDQCELVANSIMPVYHQLGRYAADAWLFLTDDTHHKILEQKAEIRSNRNGKGERLRTGVYASGLIAYTQDAREIVLFETSLGHAGEFIDKILLKRTEGLPMPAVMSDALSSNKPTTAKVLLANCNSHGRREFFDLKDKDPKRAEWVLDLYAEIWKNDHITKDENMTPQDRLAYHQKYSQPVMEKLKEWMQEQEAAEDFEEHSQFGKAIRYFLRHYSKLIMFCKVIGIPINNNRMEETLKIIIRGRKTYYFFKTINGAGIANVLTSIIATTYRANANVFDYLTKLQQHQVAVKTNPEAWMPWNYLKTCAETERIHTPD